MTVTSGNMPEWASNPHEYWKAADEHERINGRLYKEVEFSFPKELTHEEMKKAAHDFAEYLTEKERLPYTLAIHINDPNNPHCHLMISERMNDGISRLPDVWFSRANTKHPERGGAKKSTSLKPKAWLFDTRAAWAKAANEALAQAGSIERIDHRTLKDQGIEREPEIHIGPQLAAIERERKETTKHGNHNREIRARNSERAAAKEAERVAAEIETKKEREALVKAEAEKAERERAIAQPQITTPGRHAKREEPPKAGNILPPAVKPATEVSAAPIAPPVIQPSLPITAEQETAAETPPPKDWATMRWADIYRVPISQAEQKPDMTAGTVTPPEEKAAEQRSVFEEMAEAMQKHLDAMDATATPITPPIVPPSPPMATEHKPNVMVSPINQATGAPPMSEAELESLEREEKKEIHRIINSRKMMFAGDAQSGKTYKGEILFIGKIFALTGQLDLGIRHRLSEIENAAEMKVSNIPVEISYDGQWKGTVKPYVEQRRGDRSRGR